ncbi:MAG: zinc-dependent metalloprotease [Planctomycetota bacterium]|nr:zinc-dependent metalloprotease [Planctomycetota bacterium]
MRRVLSALPFLLLLALPTHAEEPAVAWDDDAFLAKALEEACVLVEQVCEAKFPERPKLAKATEKQLEEILVKEMSGIFKKFGAESEAGARNMAKAFAGALAAKYEPATKTIHISPTNIRRLVKMLEKPELASHDMIRALLVHEATHALDFMRYPSLETERQTRETQEGIQVIGAVLEGHAQFVALAAAERTKQLKGFEQFTRLIMSQMNTDDAAQRIASEIATSEIRFAYGKGHAFMRAVHAARGRKGLDAVLANPPTEIRQIERPDVYLDPEANKVDAIDFDPIVEKLEAAMKVAGVPVRSQAFSATALTSVYAPLGTERAEAVTARYEDGRLVVGSTGHGKLLVVALLAFEDEASAAGYVKALEELMRVKDEQLKSSPSVRVDAAEYSKGVGHGAKRTGFHVAKVLTVTTFAGADEQKVNVHGARVGRVVVELNAVHMGWERTQEDALMELALVALGAKPVETPEPAGAGK